jgi:ribonuclease HI
MNSTTSQEIALENKWSTWITIYTDASGNGGYAYYIRYSKEPLRIKGNGTSKYRDSNASELNAIVRAVEVALQNWDCIEGFGINSDSQTALELAKKNSPLHRRPDLRRLQLELRKLLGHRHIRCKWVKGHQVSNDVRAYLNNWCDSQARKK